MSHTNRLTKERGVDAPETHTGFSVDFLEALEETAAIIGRLAEGVQGRGGDTEIAGDALFSTIRSRYGINLLGRRNEEGSVYHREKGSLYSTKDICAEIAALSDQEREALLVSINKMFEHDKEWVPLTTEQMLDPDTLRNVINRKYSNITQYRLDTFLSELKGKMGAQYPLSQYWSEYECRVDAPIMKFAELAQAGPEAFIATLRESAKTPHHQGWTVTDRRNEMIDQIEEAFQKRGLISSQVTRA